MKVLLFASILFCSVALNAQDPHFSMPYSTSMYLNPAFAGTSGASRIQGDYRNQWPGISGTYVTSFLAYDQYFKEVSGGVGVNYLRDVSGQGTFTKNRIGLSYSYLAPFFWPNSMICFGVDGAYVQRAIDWSKLTVGISGTPVGMNKEIITYPDFSSGVFAYGNRFYGGLAAWHMTEPEESFTGSSLPMKYVGHFGVNIGDPDSLNEFSLSPSILYMQQQDFRSLIVQCAVSYSSCVVGFGYRNADAIIASAGFRNKVLRVNYSYDITVSKLGIVTAGSHELSVSFMFLRKHKLKDFLSFSTVAF